MQNSGFTLKKQIKERKRAEESLIENEERLKQQQELFQSIFVNIPVMLTVYDPKLNMLSVNREFEKTIGWSNDEIQTIDLLEECYPDPEYRKEALDYMQAGTAEWQEFKVTTKAGGIVESIWSNTRLSDDTQIGIGIDVTERKQGEEALQESERKYKTLTENSLAGVFIHQDDKYVFVNDKFAEMHGYRAEELLGKPHYELIHHDQRAVIKERVYRRLSGEKVPKQYEIKRLKKNGETVWHEIMVGDPTSYEGKPALLGHEIDITERKRAEEEKNKLEAQLLQAQKMESVGTLAGGIAHDFNNILSPIMIHTEMVMTNLPSDSPYQNNLKQIFQASERARDLVKQILTFGRMRQHERAPIKLGFVVKENIKLIRASLPATIEIIQNIVAESDMVLSDPTQINQVLMNLCTNAAHAMQEKGGELNISLIDEHLDSDAASRFHELPPGSYLRLTVSDTGHGIEPEVRNRIFEPYYTTKEVGEGTGMGLAVVHGIVKSYGGDITVESAPGEGTTFHVMLPIVEVKVSPAIEQKTELPRGSEQVLLVDDEKVAVDAIQSMLTNLGYKLTARTSSIEALEAFQNSPQAFDLVITDMTMPNMTGRELAKEIMSIRKDIPIILCTGFSDQVDEHKAKAMGISAFVMKPIVMREIANTIREVLDD